MKGLAVTNCQNLVIRNITFFNSPDGLRITTTSSNATHHIWVDHCTFTDSPAVDPNGSSHDGLLDITHRSSWITVSWCHFNNHRKTLLLGYSASGGSGETDSNQLMVTYHHNWFNKTFSRHPRARWGPVHVFNNYYLQNDYGIGSTCGARVLAEGNFFENTQVPILISQINDPGGTLSGDPVGYAKSVDNYIVGSGPLVENPGTWNFNPLTYYPYTYDAALSAKAAVMNGAGAGKIDPLVTVKDYGQNSVNPEEFALQQNYPNPFNPSTTIRYALPAATNIIIEVYDALGKKVRTLVNGYQKAGNYGVEFDSENLSAGVYFYRITTNLGSLAKKMILAK
jgi:pectate lyase